MRRNFHMTQGKNSLALAPALMAAVRAGLALVVEFAQ
jgi:hypothetical protein